MKLSALVITVVTYIDITVEEISKDPLILAG